MTSVHNVYKNRIIPKGSCEVYTGSACETFLKGKNVYIDPDMSQEETEKLVISALTVLG